MSLWNDIQPWLDPETGLMQAGDGGRDNLILMSAYLHRELVLQGESDAANELSKRALKFLISVKVKTGLYKKLSDSTDDNTEDNLTGACYWGWDIPRDIWYHWNWHLSCFDVNNPNKIALNRNFFARFIGLKAYIIAAAGHEPNIIQRLLWCISVWISIKYSTGASDPLKQMLKCEVMESITPKTVAYWKKHYSIPALYLDYFGANNPLYIYSNKG